MRLNKDVAIEKHEYRISVLNAALALYDVINPFVKDDDDYPMCVRELLVVLEDTLDDLEGWEHDACLLVEESDEWA